MKQFLSLIIFIVGSTVIVVGQQSFTYKGQKLTTAQMFNTAAYKVTEAWKKSVKKGERKGDPDTLMLLQKCVELFPSDFTCSKKFLDEFDRRKGERDFLRSPENVSTRKYLIPALSALIKQNPKNHFLYFARAIYYSDEGKYELAIEDLTDSIKFNPEKFTADYSVRARFYRKLGKNDLAVADFKIVLSDNPKDAEAVSGLINIYIEQGKGEDALALVSPFVESETELNNGWIEERARIYTAMKKFDLAMKDIDMLAKRLKPNDPNVYFNRGLIYAAQGDKAKATECFRKGYAIVPWAPGFKEELEKLGVKP